jgi:hypothetical protein
MMNDLGRHDGRSDVGLREIFMSFEVNRCDFQKWSLYEKSANVNLCAIVLGGCDCIKRVGLSDPGTLCD